MTHLSLFAGIGGFDLGFDFAGWECAAQVELDPKCREVLTRHWPEVPKYADIRDVDGRDFAGVDCITGGFPCQDLSVAGRRAGLAGARSGLWWEMHRIIGEARPRFVVWENVPGLLSADAGGAMGAVLRSLADLGYYGAWRVLDSQHFGVAQRRRRVFGVFAEGGAEGARCAEVLLEPEGSGWTPAAREGAGERVAYSLDSGAGGDSGKEQQRTFTVSTLQGSPGRGWRNGAEDAAGGHLVALEDIGRKMSGDERVGTGACEGGPMYTLQGGARHGVAYALRQDPGGVGQAHNTNYVADTLQAEYARNFNHEDRGDHRLVPESIGVRRLTPTECERLQGFPDGWTDDHADSARYRMLGNAVTVNVAYWLALRLTTPGGEVGPDAPRKDRAKRGD